MKTAISLPDPLFRLAEQMAKRLGLSRSRFFAVAVEEFVKSSKGKEITKRLNEVYSKEDSSLDPIFSEMQSHTLHRDEW